MKTYASFSEVVDIPKGAVFACPTDTVYGLSCRADEAAAVEKIRTLKGKPPHMPLIVAVGSWQQLEMCGVDTTHPVYTRVLQKVWPGPVSVVMPCTSSAWAHVVQPSVMRGTDEMNTIALRMPERADFREFLLRTGPLVSTSANLHGQPPATTREEVLAYFCSHESALDFIVDTGVCANSPSTIISLVR